MKKYISLIVLSFVAISLNAQKINWQTFEEAMRLSSIDHKPLMIDTYTDWCGWCKRMDASTFVDTAIVRYVNEHFHAVKFNAETIEKIRYKDSVYINQNILTMSSRSKAHSLAEVLLNGRMSYPTIVFMVPEIDFIAPVPGYRTPETIEPLLLYFGEEVYKINNSFDAFSKGLTINRIVK